MMRLKSSSPGPLFWKWLGAVNTTRTFLIALEADPRLLLEFGRGGLTRGPERPSLLSDAYCDEGNGAGLSWSSGESVRVRVGTPRLSELEPHAIVAGPDPMRSRRR